jgi:small GTP-binding protein
MSKRPTVKSSSKDKGKSGTSRDKSLSKSRSTSRENPAS